MNLRPTASPKRLPRVPLPAPEAKDSSSPVDRPAEGTGAGGGDATRSLDQVTVAVVRSLQEEEAMEPQGGRVTTLASARQQVPRATAGDP